MSFQQKRFNDALWRATETTFRGVLDLSQSRPYILAVLILKAISDTPLNIVVPEEIRFEVLHANRNQTDLDQRLNGAFRLLMEANPLTLAGVFSNVNFAASQLGSAAQRQTRLTVLLEAFNVEALDLRTLPNVANVIGNAYEFLIDQYATMSRSIGGEFYTPAELSAVMARLLNLQPGESVYDPTCGAGTLLLQCAKHTPGVQVYGQELNHTTYGLALLNMILHGIPADQTHIKNGDTLREPQLLIDETHIMTFDAVVGNPPFSLTQWGAEELAADKFNRLQWGMPPANKGDLAFVSHMLSSLNDTGRMAIILSNGILFRGGVEGKIRNRFLEDNLIDAVVALPAQLFYGTGIPTVMLIFKKGRTSDSILFIDASNHFQSQGGSQPNVLRYSDQQRIIDAYNNPGDIPRYSARIPVAEILSKHDGNLNVRRFAYDADDAEPNDVRGHHEGWMPRVEVEAARPTWERFGFNPYETLFTPRPEEGYLDWNPEIKQNELRALLETEAMKAKESAWHDAVIAWWFDISNQILSGRSITRESLLQGAEASLLSFGIADRYSLIDAIDSIWIKLGQHIEQASQSGAASVVREYLDAIGTNDQSRLPLHRTAMIEALFPDLKAAQAALRSEQDQLIEDKENLEETAIEIMVEEDDDSEDEDDEQPRKKPANRGIKAMESRLKDLKTALKTARQKQSHRPKLDDSDEPSVEVGRTYKDKVNRRYRVEELVSAPNMKATTWENLMVKCYEVDDTGAIRSDSLLSIRARELTLDKSQPYRSLLEQGIEAEITEVESLLTPYKEVVAKLADIKKQIASFDAQVSEHIAALIKIDAQAGLILCQLWSSIFIEPVRVLWRKQQGIVFTLLDGWWKKYRNGVRHIFRQSAEATLNMEKMMKLVYPWWGENDPKEEPAPKKHKAKPRYLRIYRPPVRFIPSGIMTTGVEPEAPKEPELKPLVEAFVLETPYGKEPDPLPSMPLMKPKQLTFF